MFDVHFEEELLHDDVKPREFPEKTVGCAQSLPSMSEESDNSASSTCNLTKNQCPSCQGYLDIFEDNRNLIGQIPFTSWFGQSPSATKELIFYRRWVVLRDCWMYIFAKETDAHLDDVSQRFTYDLRGSMCHVDSEHERTLRLETQSISLFASDARSRRVLLLRAKSETEMRLWKDKIEIGRAHV